MLFVRIECSGLLDTLTEKWPSLFSFKRMTKERFSSPTRFYDPAKATFQNIVRVKKLGDFVLDRDR